MKTQILRVGAALLLLGGCGGSSSEGGEDTHDETAGGEEHHGEHEHHAHGDHGEGGHEHAMNEGLRAFHDVLAPVFHMDPGAERANATCAAASQMTELSAAVDAAAFEGLEEGSAEAEAHQTTAAQDATGHLVELCGADEVDGAAVEQALDQIHDAFHHAMEEWREHNAEE